MVLQNEGINKVRDLVHDDVINGQLGIGGTAATPTDGNLLEPEVTTLRILDAKSKADKTVKFDYLLPSTAGTSVTFREFEIRGSATPITNYDRIVYTGISFVAGTAGTEDIIISKKYFFKSI